MSYGYEYSKNKDENKYVEFKKKQKTQAYLLQDTPQQSTKILYDWNLKLQNNNLTNDKKKKYL